MGLYWGIGSGAILLHYEKVKGIEVEAKRKCELHWIEGANHSMKVGKRHSLGQEQVESDCK